MRALPLAHRVLAVTLKYWHQQVTSTGDWWDFEETPAGFRRVYREEQDVVIDPHYFHPTEETAPTSDPVCAKCGKGPHGLSYESYPGRELSVPITEDGAKMPPVPQAVGDHGGAGWQRDFSRAGGWAQEKVARMDAVVRENAPLNTEDILPAPSPRYDPREQDIVLEVFAHMLRSVTKDGGRKRAAGVKPPWWRDNAHRAAIFSHLNKYEHGERRDPESGAHPFVHLAWRALAIAYQETYGKVDPANPAWPLIGNCVMCGEHRVQCRLTLGPAGSR
jgi:hypothetical protein